MYAEPMDIEQNVKWHMRARKGKRSCAYLNTQQDTQLCLPSSRIEPLQAYLKKIDFDKEIDMAKKICLPEKRRLKFNYANITSLFNPSSIIAILHVFLNFFLVSVIVYSVCYVVYFAKIDISYKIGMKTEEARARIEEAKRLYSLNKCDPTTRVPALELQCGQWDCLIKRGLSGIKYTRIVAELLADIADGFVGRFKLRNLAVICFFVFICLIFRRKCT
ncbi:hypothetical protein GINT2_001597 [Glugoides intestinalis]